MKITDFKNEDALEVLADILDPCVHISQDKEIVNDLRNGNRMKAVKKLLKSYKKDILEILATLDGCKVEEYECNVLTLPFKLLEILSDEELMGFFQSQGWIVSNVSSGDAMENIKEKA